MLETSPGLHGYIQTLMDNRLEGLQSLCDTALAGTIVADEDGQGGKLNGAAVLDGFEILEAEGPKIGCAHRTSPRSTSRYAFRAASFTGSGTSGNVVRI